MEKTFMNIMPYEVLVMDLKQPLVVTKNETTLQKKSTSHAPIIKVNRMRDSGLERLQAAVTSIVRPYLLKLIS